ncbi:hypothetical protein MMC18_005330, partial [Xylographa bjoerkii]|nr:hypothetical protein [Xylographa bjoerkii]
MAVNLTLSISRQFLLDLRPSADIRQAAGPGLPQLGQVWGPQDQEVPNQAAFDVGDNTLLCVLEAPLAEVQHLATTCDWLAHVAFHVFGAMGMLYEPNNALIFAPANRQLAAVDYIFYPAGIQTARSIFLMRYFPGAMPAVPAPGNTGGNVKTTFSGDVQRRENQLCKISGFDRHLGYKNVCSHLIPKRLGPHVVSHIMLRLTGRLPGWGNGPPQWDASVAVLLYGALDGFVDRFKMGFYKPKPPAPNN